MDQTLKVDYEREINAPFADSLTGLFNHGYFQMFLEREVKRYDRHGSPFTLGLIDIDRFSLFNKKHGSLLADRMLKEVADLIGANIRDVDLAARYLGDIFAVVFIMSEAEQAQVAAERLRNAVENMTHGKVTVSIGLASCYREATSTSLVRKAQDALAQAKARGKNRLHYFERDRDLIQEPNTKVLVVDDEPINLKLLQSLLQGLNYEVLKASNGEEALHMVHKAEIDLVLLDVMMPGMSGYEVCRRLKAHEATRLIPVIMLTGLSSADARVKGIEAGADDFLTKPPNRAELLARTKSLVRMKALNDNLTSVETVLVALANAIESRDAYTDGHVQRVAHLAHALGARMGLSDKELKALKLGGVLHDIGKIKIPDAILNKPGPLTPVEREVMETHADAGYSICLPLKKTLGMALDVIRYHHEKLDGSGYPDGLRKDEIPMVARIMAVVDIYDALVTDRPYRKGMPSEKSLKIINEMADEGKLDMEVTRNFSEIFGIPGDG